MPTRRPRTALVTIHEALVQRQKMIAAMSGLGLKGKIAAWASLPTSATGFFSREQLDGLGER